MRTELVRVARAVILLAAAAVYAEGAYAEGAYAEEACAEERELQATHGDSEQRRLTVELLAEGCYRLPLHEDAETPIRFHGGEGWIRYGSGETEQVRAWLEASLAVFGDLDGDLVADAAVVVKIDLGGSGTFVHLVAMLDREGRPVQAGREYLGDRVRVQSIAISGGRIVVTMIGHGPDDGLCCPTVEMRRAFTYRPTEGRSEPGRRLRRVSY